MMKLKKTWAVLLSLALILSFTACGEKPDSSSPASSAAPTASAAPSEAVSGPVTITDREGVSLVLPEKVEKIISLAPSTTQVLIDLGLEDKLVAVDKYSMPLLSEGRTLPQFDIMHPDAEQLANLQVDVIFATGMSKAKGEDPLKLLRDMGAVVTYIPTSASIAEIEKDVAFIAEVTGMSAKGQQMVEEMKNTIAQYAEIGKTITDKKTVYFEIGAAPKMYSFGKDVFLNEIIELIGAENILKDQSGWISVSAEAVAAANPDVIMSNVDYLDDPVGEIKTRAGFETLSAVKNNQVYLIDKQTSSYSNHNIVKAIREIAQAVYPEAYKGL